MRFQSLSPRLAAIPFLALALTGTAVAPSQANGGQDLTEPYAITTDGTAPLAMAASPTGRHLFIANQMSDAITIISTDSNSQVGSIPLPKNGNGIAVAPDGTVWATQKDSHTVAKIVDPLSAAPAVAYHQADAALTGRPTSLAFSRSGDVLYISDSNVGPGVSKITALSATTGAILHESALIQNASSVLSVAPDGSVWVAGDTPRVFTADLSSSVPMPGAESGRSGQVTFSLDSTTAYVALSDSIKVVDIETMHVIHTINDPADSLFSDVAWLALSPDSKTLYAVNYEIPTMTVIDIAGAITGAAGAMTQIDGPLANPGNAYLNAVVALGNAFYVAVDGPNLNGTTVMRYPVEPEATSLTTATPGSNLVLNGSALVGAKVTIGGVPATTLASGYSSASVKVPDLSSLPSASDVPVSVITDSGTTNAQVDVTPATVTPRLTGTARVGTPLTVVPGAWSPGTKYGFQWFASGKAIGGANKATFTPTSAHVGKAITAQVTGSYSTWGKTAKTSTATARVSVGTLRALTPKISGTPKIGRKVTAKPGSWTPGTKFSYQWYAGGKPIKGATRSSLKINAKLKHKTLKVKVTGTKAGYAKVAKTSKSTKKVK